MKVKKDIEHQADSAVPITWPTVFSTIITISIITETDLLTPSQQRLLL